MCHLNPTNKRRIMYDILVKGGKVIDPSQSLSGLCDVALEGGRVAEVAKEINETQARNVIDAEGLLVTPGLVDIHIHAHWGVSHWAIEPDLACLPMGVTTAVEAGSAGGYTYPSLKRYIIERCQTRLYAFLNISSRGMLVPEVGELEDLRYVDKDLAIRVGRDRSVVGIKARMDRVGEHLATEPLRAVIEVAGELGKLAMIHIGDARRMHVPLGAVLELMRPGDIVTHTYHGHFGGIVDEDGKLRSEVLEARQRGILFDVGHGSGSFAFRVARAALLQDFKPDTISSDLHYYSVAGPVFDLPTTMSKFLHLGLNLEEVIELSTWAPAKVLGIEEQIGTLKVGAEGDVCILRLGEGEFKLHDCEGQVEPASRLLSAVKVIKGGQLSARGPLRPSYGNGTGKPRIP